jgi:cell wall-associated NlpC family hydrolase
MYRKITEASAGIYSAVETGNHSKNGASPKSLMSRGNFTAMIFCLIVGFILISCKKHGEDSSSIPDDESVVSVPDDGFIADSLADSPLSDEFLSFLESLPVTDLTVDDFNFENLDSLKAGSNTVSILKNTKAITPFCRSEIDKLFFEMGKFALSVTKSDFNNDFKQKLAANNQQKLAYIYGSKDYTKKHNGDYWVENEETGVYDILKHSECQEYLYGLDCSGFVKLVFNSVGIKIPDGSGGQFNFIKGLDNSFLDATDYKGYVIVEELEENDVNESGLKSGDIIFKYDPARRKKFQHVGIILETKSKDAVLFQSVGSDKKLCEYNKSYGPVSSSLSNENIKDYFKPETGRARVLRISPKIFETDPDNIQFDYISEKKSFTVKTCRHVEIEEIKSLNEDICTVQSPIFADVCGDTIIHTVNLSFG